MRRVNAGPRRKKTVVLLVSRTKHENKEKRKKTKQKLDTGTNGNA